MPVVKHVTDRTAILIACSISFVCSVCMLVCFATLKRWRNRPGGAKHVLLCLTIFDGIAAMNYFIPPFTNVFTCQLQATIMQYFETGAWVRAGRVERRCTLGCVRDNVACVWVMLCGVCVRERLPRGPHGVLCEVGFVVMADACYTCVRVLPLICLPTHLASRGWCVRCGCIFRCGRECSRSSWRFTCGGSSRGLSWWTTEASSRTDHES